MISTCLLFSVSFYLELMFLPANKPLYMGPTHLILSNSGEKLSATICRHKLVAFHGTRLICFLVLKKSYLNAINQTACFVYFLQHGTVDIVAFCYHLDRTDVLNNTFLFLLANSINLHVVFWASYLLLI